MSSCYGRYLDDERPVYVADYHIHTGKTNHLVELILSFVYASVPRHEGADFAFPLLGALRQITTYCRDFAFRKIWVYLRTDEQYFFYRILHLAQRYENFS